MFSKGVDKLYKKRCKMYWLVGWLVGFNGISTFVGYSMPNQFFIHLISSISNNSV